MLSPGLELPATLPPATITHRKEYDDYLSVTKELQVEEPPDEQLVCYRSGTPTGEWLSRINEALFPLPIAAAPAPKARGAQCRAV